MVMGCDTSPVDETWYQVADEAFHTHTVYFPVLRGRLREGTAVADAVVTKLCTTPSDRQFFPVATNEPGTVSR
jgi:hypothetical protein